MKQLFYMGNFKGGLSAYLSSIMLMSRKLTKDKREVTDFRHLNVRIAKNNLAYPLVRGHIFCVRKIKVQSSFYVGSKRCLPLT